MKNGTMYAARLRKVYTRLRESVPTRNIPEPGDPVRCLAVAILGENCTDDDAERAIERAFSTMVDWNEMRVSSAVELNKATGNTIPQGTQRCQRLAEALQAIFDRENRLSLDKLKGVGRRDARHYLEELNGVDEYVVASVVLWSLGGHAIPVNDRLLEALRAAELVHPAADRAEVQAFLERNISATDAKEFCLVMRGFQPSKRPGAKRVKARTATKKKNT